MPCLPNTLKHWVGVQRGQSYLMASVSLALIDHPSSDGVTIKLPYGVNALLYLPVSHHMFSYWVLLKLNLNLLLDQLTEMSAGGSCD